MTHMQGDDCWAPGPEERVVLVDRRGQAIGEHAKSSVHSDATPLHLAFSLYLFDSEDRLLMTRRSLAKLTWPGVWTNSCCGHPMPDEAVPAAVRRRCATELGVQIDELRCVLPSFSYREQDAGGVWENEFCPVFTARVHPGDQVRSNSAEVMEIAWTDWAGLRTAVAAAPFAFSPWAVAQVREMAPADPTRAPPGAREGHDEPSRASTRH